MAATLLDEVTSTGAGNAFSAGDIAPAGSSHKGILSKIGVTVAYKTAAPTVATIVLQGSVDKITWVDLGDTSDVSATSVGFAVDGAAYSVYRGNLTVYTAGSNAGVTVKCSGI